MSTRVVPSLLRTVRAEWTDRWAGRPLLLPLLGLDTAAGWLARVRGCAGPEQDVLLGALLDAAASGEQAAGRTLLQLLIPPTDRAATATRLLADHDPADRPGLVVAAVWEAIRLARPDPNPRHVYVTLLRAATARLAPTLPAGQRQLRAATEMVDPALLIDLVGAGPDQRVPPEVRLGRLLETAVRSRVVTPGEVGLLHRVLLDGRTAVDVATGTGTSAASLRKRVQRIIARLRHAAEAGLL